MIYAQERQYTIYNTSCLDAMDAMDDNSIDAIVTDPPYEIGFMNKGWDNTGVAFSVETWRKALRVLKPGGYLLAFNHSRTFHRMMVAIEDAGFELRDTIMWLYGSGFPKSHDVSKAIDKSMGAEREVVGKHQQPAKSIYTQSQVEMSKDVDITAPPTYEAKQWDGWGTALKPAFEPIVVARKPIEGTVANNVLKYGVGGINIDECKVEGVKEGNPNRYQNVKRKEGAVSIFANGGLDNDNPIEQNGRFPANIIHNGSKEATSDMWDWETGNDASRYFYTAKASVKDRDEGLDKFIQTTVDDGREKLIDNAYQRGKTLRKNIHPTVKPTDLMQYLVRLVAPKGATVLDPFMGSGSTGKACMIENVERDANYHFVGIDLEEEYCQIAQARIDFGINYENRKDEYVMYNDNGTIEKVVQDKLDLFGDVK